ncbi:MAG TPA: hypothetical protein VGK63_03025, partial [Candidatus Limnocylindrales bacterium]
TTAEVRVGGPDDTTFGALARSVVAALPQGQGLVVAGSGSAPLARTGDLRPFVQVAGSGEPRALVNNRYSADLVALGDPAVLRRTPDLPSDNALPRWLEEVARTPVEDRPGHWRLAFDIDSPLDVLLAGIGEPPDGSIVGDRLDRVAATLRDRRGEVLVAGRTSAATLRLIERQAASRTRALVEERGLRASSRLAFGGDDGRSHSARPPASVLAMLLADRGPGALGRIVADLADAAVVDSRVLMAARWGADEGAWPRPEDRYASDLLLAERIEDPWLRDLTAAARDAPIPVVLGAHSMVGPGARLLLRRARGRA